MRTRALHAYPPRNSGTHGPDNGRVSVRHSKLKKLQRENARLKGNLIPPERIRRVDGHGLGLAILRAIVSAHGATLIPRARPEGGLDIEVSFP